MRRSAMRTDVNSVEFYDEYVRERCSIGASAQLSVPILRKQEKRPSKETLPKGCV
jgi:hypothetical protein